MPEQPTPDLTGQTFTLPDKDYGELPGLLGAFAVYDASFEWNGPDCMLTNYPTLYCGEGGESLEERDVKRILWGDCTASSILRETLEQYAADWWNEHSQRRPQSPKTQKEYHSLLAACAALSFDADHCDIDLMPERQVRDILRRVQNIAQRKDVRGFLYDQVRPVGDKKQEG